MAIDNGVALIGSLQRLIDALGIQGDHFLRSREELEKCLQIGLGQTTGGGQVGKCAITSVGPSRVSKNPSVYV